MRKRLSEKEIEKTAEKKESPKIPEIKNDLSLQYKKVTLNNTHVKTFLITDFPTRAVPGLLYALTHEKFAVPERGSEHRVYMNYALHIKPAQVQFNWKMNMKIDRLQKNIESYSTEKLSDTAREEEQRALDALLHFRDGTAVKNYVEVWLSVTISSEDLKLFKKRSRLLKNYLKYNGFKYNELPMEQHKVLTGAWALGDNTFLHKYRGRIMDMDALSVFYPFLDGSISSGLGCYIGHRAKDGTMVYKNFKDSPDDQNILVTGTTGGGKSYFIKALIISLLLEMMKGYVYDVDGEYFNLCREVGGEWVDYTMGSGKFIDPTIIEPSIFLEIDPETLDPYTYEKVKEADDARYIEALNNTLGVIGLLVEDFNVQKQNALEYALIQMWEEAGIREEDISSWEIRNPEIVSFRNLYERIKAQGIANSSSAPHKEGARELQEDLWSYFEGGKKYLFRHADPGDWIRNSNLTVFHVASSVDNEVDQKMGAVKIVMISNMVWRQVKRDRLKAQQYSFGVYDELQRLIKNPYAQKSVYRDITTGRKFNYQVVLGFNDPSILFDGNEGIWNNAKYNVLFGLKKNTIEDIGKKSAMPEEVIDQWINLPQYSFIYKERVARGDAYDILRVEIPKSEGDKLGKTRGLR